MSKKNVLKNISFHKTCKCGCLLDEKVCNKLQNWNKEKCKCEYLKIKKFDIGYSRNVNNCRCEMERLALVQTEECDIETDQIIKNTVKLIKKDCKPFISASILFVCTSIILTGKMIYFYLKSRKNIFLPY